MEPRGTDKYVSNLIFFVTVLLVVAGDCGFGGDRAKAVVVVVFGDSSVVDDARSTGLSSNRL